MRKLWPPAALRTRLLRTNWVFSWNVAADNKEQINKQDEVLMKFCAALFKCRNITV